MYTCYTSDCKNPVSEELRVCTECSERLYPLKSSAYSLKEKLLTLAKTAPTTIDTPDFRPDDIKLREAIYQGLF